MSKPLWAIGLMSGTSLDGIDVAMIETDGRSHVRRGPSATFPYDDAQRSLLRQALTDAVDVSDRSDRKGALGRVEWELTRWHADAVHAFLSKFDVSLENIDIIGFHGQTVLHRPEQRLTVQLGDGAELAHRLGTVVANDMRAADVAAGGQGAPLVPVYHQALAAALPQRPVAFVNIGGVANVTWIGPEGHLLAFDTGPGNALIDDWVKTHTGQARDDGGRLALAGRVDEVTATRFLGDPFFDLAAPKSLDRNSFASISLEGLSLEDGAATLVSVTVRAIAMARKHFPVEPRTWVICGGGRHNAAIMKALRRYLGGVETAESFRFDGDAMEAEAWAYLAVRCLYDLPLTFPGTTGVSAPMTGGRLARPARSSGGMPE